MTINSVRTIEFDNDGSKLTVDATTWLPATPTLLIFCCGYRLLPKKVKRGGKDVPHGNLLYLDCTPSMFDPDITGGTEFHWEVANNDYVPGCKDCHLAIVELADQPKVDWTTQVYRCPPVPIGAVHFDGAVEFTTGALGGGNVGVLTASFWYRTLSDQSSQTLWEGDYLGNQESVAFLNGANTPSVLLSGLYSGGPDPDGTLDFSGAGAAAFGAWHHCMYLAQPGALSATVYIDDLPATEIDFTEPPGFSIIGPGFSFVFGSDGFGNGTVCDLAELWMDFASELNPADEATRRLFISADGQPVDLGPNGEVPTGSPPTIFGHGDASTFLQPNLGTGGPLALSGALSDAAPPAPGL